MASPVALTGAGNVTTVQDTDITGAETLSISKPANLADNEVLCIVVNGRNASLTWDVVPSGFVQQKHVNDSGTLSLFTKKIRTASSEPSTYGFSPSAGAGRCGAVAFRVQSANVGNHFDAAGSNQVNSDVAPSVTPGGIDRLLLGVYVTFGSSAMTITAPAGMTLVGDVSIGASTSWSRLAVFQQALTTSSATGTRTASVSPAPSARNNFLATLKPEILASTSMSASARVGSGFSSKRRLLAQQDMGAEVGLIAEGDIIVSAPEGAMGMSTKSGIAMAAKAIRDGSLLLSSGASVSMNPAYGEYNVMNSEGDWQTVPVRRMNGSWA